MRIVKANYLQMLPVCEKVTLFSFYMHLNTYRIPKITLNII